MNPVCSVPVGFLQPVYFQPPNLTLLHRIHNVVEGFFDFGQRGLLFHHLAEGDGVSGGTLQHSPSLSHRRFEIIPLRKLSNGEWFCKVLFHCTLIFPVLALIAKVALRSLTGVWGFEYFDPSKASKSEEGSGSENVKKQVPSEENKWLTDPSKIEAFLSGPRVLLAEFPMDRNETWTLDLTMFHEGLSRDQWIGVLGENADSITMERAVKEIVSKIQSAQISQVEDNQGVFQNYVEITTRGLETPLFHLIDQICGYEEGSDPRLAWSYRILTALEQKGEISKFCMSYGGYFVLLVAPGDAGKRAVQGEVFKDQGSLSG